MEKPELKLLLKALLDGVCLLESCQWKCKRGEVSRLAVFCSLLFRLTLSGQPLRPVIQVVCSLCGAPSPLHPPHPPPRPSRAHKHARHRQLPPRAVVSSLHQSQASAAMGTSVWANEQHLFLSSMAVHANHNTHFIWPLSCSQSQHVIHQRSGRERLRQKEARIISPGKGPSRKWLSQHKCHSKCALHHCIIGKKYLAIKQPFDRTEGSLFSGEPLEKWLTLLPFKSVKALLVFVCANLNCGQDYLY